jgi:hypothetical protein
MKSLFIAKMKVAKIMVHVPHRSPILSAFVDKVHIIEAKDETDAREKLNSFYHKKGKYEFKHVDIEEVIK